jgi:hypothetical protein
MNVIADKPEWNLLPLRHHLFDQHSYDIVQQYGSTSYNSTGIDLPRVKLRTNKCNKKQRPPFRLHDIFNFILLSEHCW